MTVKQNDAATTPTNQKEQGQQKHSGQQGLAARDVSPFMSPFAMLQRFFNDDITSVFDAIGGGTTRSQPLSATATMTLWVPKIDVLQRGDEFVVRADLPGVSPDDVTVEISDEAITISGERRQERTEEHNGVYRVERTFGSFYREIPLPQGAIADKGRAAFKDGVLEIAVPAPPEQVSRGRRLEITRGDEVKSNEAGKHSQ